MNVRQALLCCALAVAPSYALAQAAAPAPAAVVKNPCEKPDPFPGTLATDKKRAAWQKTLDVYGQCIKKFTDEQRVIAEGAIKAGNDAVTEYNAVVQNAKDEVAKSGGTTN